MSLMSIRLSVHEIGACFVVVRPINIETSGGVVVSPLAYHAGVEGTVTKCSHLVLNIVDRVSTMARMIK